MNKPLLNSDGIECAGTGMVSADAHATGRSGRDADVHAGNGKVRADTGGTSVCPRAIKPLIRGNGDGERIGVELAARVADVGAWIMLGDVARRIVASVYPADSESDDR